MNLRADTHNNIVSLIHTTLTNNFKVTKGTMDHGPSAHKFFQTLYFLLYTNNTRKIK